MKVLVTGASGFTGHYLIKHLLSLFEGAPQLWGISRSAPQFSLKGCTYMQADLNQRNQIDTIIKQIAPDAVIHLAGLNRGSLTELLHANVINTENLLEAVRNNVHDARILVVGSSAEYGSAGDSPISEDVPLHPIGSYGISKMAEDLLAHQYFAAHNLNVAVARPFNLIGPGQSDSFVCGRLTHQATEIRNGMRDAFELGGGDARRDFVDVRDVVDAYWKLISHENFKERVAGRAFNIGSGRSYSISDVIQEISMIIGKSYPVYMPLSPMRELVPVQIADNSLIERETGWSPSIPFCRSLKEMIEYIPSLHISDSNDIRY